MEDSYVLQLQEPKFKEFYLSYSGYAQCGPLHCYGPASRPHYLIHFVVKGKGMYQASGQKHYLTAGQGFLIEPGTQTFYQADKDDPWSYLWIGVGGNNAGKYIRDIGLNSEQLIFHSESGEELKKIVRVMKKIDENVPNEVMLVLDATTGQNAVSQMKIFGQAVNVTGLCLTKLDGTAKGGVVFALADKFKVPLRYVGIGEKSEDLREFDIDSFVDALFD